MAKYIDENGLLYLLQDLLARIKAKQDPITITEAISSTSTNSTVAGAKAVYDYVTSAIAGITKLTAQIVTTLPTTGESNILYLVPKSTAATDNAYDEYMWISNKWELIGTTAVDLSGYLKTTDIADWAKQASKPTYTAAEVGAAAASHKHTKSDITDFPTALKNPNALTVQFNGTTQAAYDGSAAKTVNITPSGIGASASGHKHGIADITDFAALTNAEIEDIIATAEG